MTSGYSGTPLAKKLGLKTGMSMLVQNAPRTYEDYFLDYPEDIASPTKPKPETLDFIHIFETEFAKLGPSITCLKPLLKKNGTMWISWPKGSSKIPTDIKRDPMRELILGLGLVDVKICAIDQDWSGLKFVYRLKDR